MRTLLLLAAAAGLSACAAEPKPATKDPAPATPRRRGFATADAKPPARFPHRIWAASGFEARPANFGWFGAAETKNIPEYPGNTAARRGTPQKKHAALKTGMNPVPGPRMGTTNYLYCRYVIKGTDRAVFQHYSLSSGDNCNIRVSGLTQGKWSELLLNFTRDSRRNDGSPGAFKKGERMDDLQVYVGKPDDGKTYEVIIDDAIFFAEEPGLPPEPEPFPRRVMFLAAFDTGINPASARAKYFPGQWALPERPPAGSYWQVAAAVPVKGGEGRHVRLEMKPPRPVGPNTKLRFRCHLKGASKLTVSLHDATAKKDRSVELADCAQGKWTTRYVAFSTDGKAVGGGRMPAGSKVDAVTFAIPPGKDAALCVDEVVLYDAGK